MAQTIRAAQPAAAMAAAAQAFLDSLDVEQRRAATAPFDTPDHREWTYLPGPRPGLALADMEQHQRDLGMELLATGLSERGLRTAEGIMWLEGVLRELERTRGKDGWQRRDPTYFWIRILGDPTSGQPWAWRVNGHHVACHLTVIGDAIAATPQFFGANPAVVPSGPHVGHQALPDEEHLARELLAGLDDTQRTLAIVDSTAPWDIHTRRDPVADLAAVPRGVAYSALASDGQDRLKRLIQLYLERITATVAGRSWQRIEDAGLEAVTFAWAGSEVPGEAHYYAVCGPTFLLEYDNTQDNANHVHTVWRDLSGDWGTDLLAEHYAAHHV